MQAIVLSFDSLAARAIGCYGNEWIETPHFDRLAATSVVFDLHFADSVDENAGLAWVTDRSSAQSAATNSTSIGVSLRQAGVKTRLISATPSRTWQDRAQFDQRESVEGQTGSDAEPSNVPIAELVKAGLAAWNDPAFQGTNRLLWLHAPEPGTPPNGFDSLYFEDFEERGQAIDQLTEEERLAHPAMYGGSVSLIDHWLGELINGLGLKDNSAPTLLIVTAARGQVWQRIRNSTDSASTSPNQTLIDQTIQTPFILSVVNDDRFAIFQSQRSNRLMQSQDLLTTLLEWFRNSTTDADARRSHLRELMGQSPERTHLRIVNGENEFAIRTPDWLAIHQSSHIAGSDASNQGATPRLFVKPEDVWDMNDVAAQYPEIVSKLLTDMTL